MALNKEIWANQIAEIFTSDNSFASKLTNYSDWVNGKYVHMPTAGTISNLISKNLTSWPITGATSRTDADQQVTMDTFYMNPIVLTTPIEELELNYNKRQSVMSDSLSQLLNAAHDSMILNMAQGATVYTGNGTARAAYHATQTGNRSGITFATIQKAHYLFNSQNLPAEGRFLLVPAELQEDIISMSQFQYSYTLTNSAVVDGFIGKIAGFQVVVRDKVLVTNSANTLLSTQTMAATYNAACLAFHTSTNVKALGEIKVFEDLGNPNYMGDIISAYVRSVAANKYGTSTPKGVAVLAECAA